jgi:hypothetical protein
MRVLRAISLLTRVSWGQSPGMYACFASDFLAKCREQQVANQTRSTALKVRFIVGYRENPGTVPEFSIGTVLEFVCVLERDSPRVCTRVLRAISSLVAASSRSQAKLARLPHE